MSESPRRTLGRILWIGAGTTALFAAAAAVIGPRMVGRVAQDRLLEELTARGLTVTVDSVSVGATEASLERLCIFDPPPNQQTLTACFDRIELGYAPGALARGRFAPNAVRILGAEINARAEAGDVEGRVAAWQAQLQGHMRRNPPAEPRPGRVNSAGDAQPIELLATNVRVVVDGQPWPLQGIELERLEGTFGGQTSAIDARVNVQGGRLPEPLSGNLPEEWQITVGLQDGAPNQVQLHPETALQLAAPSVAPGVSLELDGASFAMPYHFTVFGVRLRHTSMTEPVLEWATATLTLRELTTDLEQLYMTSLEVSSPRVRLQVNSRGEPTLLAALAQRVDGSDEATPATPQPEAGSGAEAAGAGSGELGADAGSGAAVAAAASEPLWAGRQWWEKIPQRIVMSDLRVELSHVDNPGAVVALTDASLEYALRIFNFQLDVTLRGALERDGAPKGTLDTQVVWGWERSNLRLDLNAQDVDLAAVAAPLCEGGCGGLAGLFDLRLHIDEAERGPGLNVEGELGLTSAVIPVQGLQAPLPIDALTYTFDGRRSRDEEPVALRFDTGDGMLNGARFELRPVVFGFEYTEPPFAERIDWRLAIPDQPAQDLFRAIPASLLGPLAGTELGGTFGWALEFTTRLVPSDGDLLLEIDEPTRSEMRDEALTVVSLPEAVDVRRLNSSFAFTFRGPDDTINRLIHVPPPADAVPPADALTMHPWARLSEMSWYLIAAQLYREDGRFFENRGINWYQMRNVVEEAWAAGALGRGASTISMQLVKNVFLSHERAVERKAQELFLTYWMTRLVPKDRILEVYLNVIEWGPGINGIVEAAQHYFGRSPADLSIAESVWLSAITPAPQRRAPQRAQGAAPAWMMRQIADLLSGLAANDWISDGEAALGASQPVVFVTGTDLGAPTVPNEGSGGGSLDGDVLPVKQTETGGFDGSGLAALPVADRVGALLQRARPTR